MPRHCMSPEPFTPGINFHFENIKFNMLLTLIYLTTTAAALYFIFVRKRVKYPPGKRYLKFLYVSQVWQLIY